jgi:hypothetical protein
MIFPLLLLSQFITSALTAPSFKAKAWQSIGHDFTFPEQEYSDIMSKPNVGVTFSGGGDRAFTCTIGYMAGFHELGLVDHFRYMAGSSGGSWGTVVYSYFQHDDIDDTTMLGPIVLPQDIIFEELEYMDDNCVRRYVNTTYVLTGIFFSDWMEAVQVFITHNSILSIFIHIYVCHSLLYLSFA